MNLISVVVPIYNVAPYLSACIESVVRQSYEYLQILLIDDGSTDESPRICEEWACKDERIEVVHKSNGGLSDARNVGIEHAKGEYITFVDSDDVLAHDMVEYLFCLLEKSEADIAVCQSLKIDDEGKPLSADGALFVDYVIRGNKACMHDFLALHRIDTTAWGKLYKRRLFDGVRYPVGKYHEDVFTTYRLVALSDAIAVGGAKKYNYRVRNASIMQSSFSPKHLDAVRGKMEMADFVSFHYPLDLPYAQAAIVYAANQCVWRMGVSRCRVGVYQSFLQEQYRNFEFVYLRYGAGRSIAKLFSLCAYLSVAVTVWFISIVYGNKK